MSIIQSIFLGIVQGITEFLPISSSGHLAILKNLLGIQIQGSLFFDVLLHLGTMAAVIFAFRRDIGRMIAELICMFRDILYNIGIFRHNHKEQDAKRYRKIVHNNYRKFVGLVFVSTIPTAVIGYAARDLVSIAEQTLIVPGVCLILTAGLLLVADVMETEKKIPKDITYTNGFMIGVVQGLSVIPGISRSGATITACLISGFDRKFAVKYSFIMSVPAILGAVVLECGELSQNAVTVPQFFIYLAGAVTAGIVGYFVIKKMLFIVRKKKFKIFALYCLALGTVAIAGHFVNR